MAKKTFLKVKRGLITPKHRIAMESSVWLFLYILDRTDWDNGTVADWRDADAAEALGMSIPGIRKYRRRLEDTGYIASRQGLHCQVIYVNNWSNPKNDWNGNGDMPKQSNVFKHYQDNIAMLTPMMADELKDAEKEYGEEWIIEAINLAVKANVRKWSYVKAILERWAKEGKTDKKKVISDIPTARM